MCFQRVITIQTKTRCLRDKLLPQNGYSQINPPNQDTAEAAIKPEKLLELSQENADAAVDLKLFRTLMEKKVGTLEIEQVALSVGAGKGQKRKFRIPEIKEHRVWKDVERQLTIKIESCIRTERETRINYKAAKQRIKSEAKSAGKMSQFKKLVSRVGRLYRKIWSTGVQKVQEKVKWLEYKILGIESRGTSAESRSQWISRLSIGAAEDRKRYRCDIPLYGGVVVDQDEENAAKLGPKFTLYPKIKIENVKWASMCKDTKIRWGRKLRLIDKGSGDIIHEDLGQQTDEQILEDNVHREPYDHVSKTIDFRKVMPTDIKNNHRVMTRGTDPQRKRPY